MDFAPKIPLAAKVTLVLALYFAISIALFLAGWQIRVNELSDILASEKEAGVTAYSTQIRASFDETNPTRITFVLTNVESLVSTNWPTLTNDGGDQGLQNRACRDLPLSSLTLLPPWVTQDATYESVGRKLEGCMGRDKDNEALKLCTGTRLEAKAAICLKTKQIVDRLYQFETTFMGATSRLMTIATAIIFGTFQVIAVLVAIITYHRAQTLFSQITETEPNAGSDGGFLSISSAVREAKSGVVPGQISSAAIVEGRMRSYRNEVRSKFDSLRDRGDNIVQFGLLGTLTGMLLLFGSLEKAESSDPLTAQLSLSGMLGSLGLAFGTTIFAIILRMYFVHRLDPVASRVLELIRVAETGAREEMENSYVREVEESAASVDIWEEGAAILGGTKGQSSSNTNVPPTASNGGNMSSWMLLLFALLVGFILVFALDILFVSGG